MANGISKRTRSQRVASVELPPGLFDRMIVYLQRGDILFRLGLCLLTAIALWMITGSWRPALGYRTGYTPPRTIVAQVEFKRSDPQATREAKDRARRQVLHVYQNDPELLVQLRAQLINRITTVLAAQTPEQLDRAVWNEFFSPGELNKPVATVEEQDTYFIRFRSALVDQAALEKFEKELAVVFAPIEQHGLIDKLPQEHDEGNQLDVSVYTRGNKEKRNSYPVSKVLIGDANELKELLQTQIKSTVVAARVFDWLRKRLPNTLTYDREETEEAIRNAERLVPEQFNRFKPGDPLAAGGKPLDKDSLQLLTEEHVARDASLTVGERVSYSLATFGMFIALATLCGVYAAHYEPAIFANGRRFGTMIALIVTTVGLAILGSGDAWRAEVVPLLLFGMIVSLAYHQETAMLFSAAMALVITVALGQSLGAFISLSAAVVTVILLTTNIRSRSKLIYVGLCTGTVAVLTNIGVGVLDEQPLRELAAASLYYGIWSFLAGFIMTGLLPFIENIFGVQTEISLLELGDVAHPLLQELVRRAPGTYNHSINVASIAEAAAESIGANGLLVRVGAYFHDIGKMLKPQYFIENQGVDNNRHDQLLPAMSTLIIIAHIKDGADLARQHHLPQPIIDFIQQHHGTTLVEYFYRRAQSEADPDAPDVEEASFRYPGPKPQTKEAAVLMMADAVEGASRALVEPTPARIESLVHDIAIKRLLDGQFDSCGLTLQELATIEDSLVKSLTAVYHGRIKYPDQQRSA